MSHYLTRALSAAAIAAALSLPGAAATSTWQIDPNHSAAQFAVRHLSISTVRGAFTKVSGTVQLDDKDVSKSSVDVEQVEAGKLKVTGDLTIHGVTKQAVLDVEGPTAPVKDPWGNQRAAVNATTKINRQDFGVKWNAKMDGGGLVVGDDVAITIDAEMVQKGAAKAGN